MIDAAQARVVAYTTPDGEILCAEHTEEAYGDEIRQYVEAHGIVVDKGTSFDLWEALDAAGLTAISRYDLGEIESQRLYNLEPEQLVEWLDREDRLGEFAGDIIRRALHGEPVYVEVEQAWDDSMLARERCDNDGKII